MSKAKSKFPAEGFSRVYSKDGGFTDLPFWQAQQAVRESRGALSFEEFPPLSWEKELPKYRATRALKPPVRPIDCHHPVRVGDPDTWQYAEGPVAAGEVLETSTWPHASLAPLNDSAKAVLKYFTSGQSFTRMPRAPWKDGQVFLPASQI